jgi:hypothetical protein
MEFTEGDTGSFAGWVTTTAATVGAPTVTVGSGAATSVSTFKGSGSATVVVITGGIGIPVAFALKKGTNVGTFRASIQRRFPRRTLSSGTSEPSAIQSASSPKAAS